MCWWREDFIPIVQFIVSVILIMGKIRELPVSSARVLTSAQIISSVFCVVKELVENALDSDAKNVEVKLEDFGLTKIEVRDNGCGIDKNDIEFVARPHFTSKITSLTDLENIKSYGFRGEALGAICAVADLNVTTKSASENVGSVTNFDCSGLMISSKPTPYPQGTSVSVLNLFKNIPVRRQYYRSDKNKKDELRRVEELLIAYGIIHNAVRFTLSHNKSIIWQKIALPTAKDAVIQAFGRTVFDNLKHIQYQNDESKIKMDLYLPKINAPSICGFSSLSRSIVAINKRPVRLKSIDKLLKQSYNAAVHNTGRAKYPVCYVSFTLPSIEVDVNIEPNKTSVMLRNSEEIFSQFSNLLKTFYKGEEESLRLASNGESTNLSDSNSLNSNSNAEHLLNDSCLPSASRLTAKQTSDDRIEMPNAPSCLGDAPMTKRDIHVIEASQSVKKKQKTGSCSSKLLDNHLNSLKSFFQSSDSSSENLGANLNASITVHRTPSEKGLFHNGKASWTNQRKISEFTMSSDCSSNSSLRGEKSLIGQPLIFDNESSRNIGTSLNAPTVGEKAEGEGMNSIGSILSVHFRNEENGCKSMKERNTNESINSCESTVENALFEQTRSVKASANLLDESDFSEDDQSHENDQSSKTISVSMNNEQNVGTLWSRGVHPSGETLQPVAVLQPKTIAAACSKQPSVEPKQKPASIMQPNLSFERKFTAFDAFCRSNRLEIAAANPELSNQQIAQMLSEKWGKLSSFEKSVFNNMIDKKYPKEVKKKENLGKTISQNLCLNKRSCVSIEKTPTKFKEKKNSTFVVLNMKIIENTFPLQKSQNEEDILNVTVVGPLMPGIWLCRRQNILSTLNTFRLQEIIIYHRLLGTYQFEAEDLETPVVVPESHLGDEAFSVLSQLQRDSDGNVIDPLLIANGFDIRFIENEDGSVCIQLLGILKNVAYYGVSDLKECLILIKESGFSSQLSDCRPAKLIFYLKSEANRMCRQTPPIQRKEDVEDLLAQKQSVIPTSDVCMHHKPFFHEIWTLESADISDV